MLGLLFAGWLLWEGAKSYTNHAMIRLYEQCSINGQDRDPKLVREMARCMYPQAARDPLLRWIGHIDRYRYLAHPDLPCRFVGEWSSGRGQDLYIATLRADGTDAVRPVRAGVPNVVEEATMSGSWSAIGADRIIWFYPSAFVWPLDENPVRWIDDDHLLLTELDGSETRYRRLSPLQPDCY